MTVTFGKNPRVPSVLVVTLRNYPYSAFDASLYLGASGQNGLKVLALPVTITGRPRKTISARYGITAGGIGGFGGLTGPLSGQSFPHLIAQLQAGSIYAEVLAPTNSTQATPVLRGQFHPGH